MKKTTALLFLLCAWCTGLYAATSPNGKLRVSRIASGLQVDYKVHGKWQEVMRILCDSVTGETATGGGTANYEMMTGKRKHCTNAYTETEYTLAGDKGIMQLRVYNDGLAWHTTGDSKVSMTTSVNRWLQNWSEGYEDFFPKNPALKAGQHMGFPALFEYSGDVFLLLTESNVSADCSASSFYTTEQTATYDIRAAEKGEQGWITAIVGSLADVVESTLVTDNSAPSTLGDTSWIQPGVASWVYWAYNHGSKDFNIVKKYIDMAIKMQLPYVLIDAEWDEMQGEHTIEEALAYACDNGIRPIIWYNSCTGWINGPGPKWRLNKKEDREKEFAWCKAHGICGVKIDFFGGDTNLNIKYMHELLECAARYNLLVNFHGVTIPRGWQRTYPNLVSLEGVYGAEWYNNKPILTNKAAAHNATLPFTRNVIGSMDYTPCAFSDSQHPHITTHAHELALTVLFESGVQHLADRPESFYEQPDEVRNFLSDLPTAWDETYLLSGYPGESVVLARKKGDKVYIASINGCDEECTLTPDWSRLSSLKPFKKMVEITDVIDNGKNGWSFKTVSSLPKQIKLYPRGGFIIKMDLK